MTELIAWGVIALCVGSAIGIGWLIVRRSDLE